MQTHIHCCGVAGVADALGLEVTNADGQPINFLHLKPGDPLAREEKYVAGMPLYGGRVTFGALAPDYAGLVYVTIQWRTALMLHRCKRQPSVACLFHENVQEVVTSIAERAPKAQFIICFDGTDDESDNPKLEVIYGLSKKVSATLIPSGQDTTFEGIYAQAGAEGIDEHLRNARATHRPWESADPCLYLENVKLTTSQPRSARTTTPTSYETLVAEEWLPSYLKRYMGKP